MQRSPKALAVEQELHRAHADSPELNALREENARLREAVKERLPTLSEDTRRAVLQQHAELCAQAQGVEAIPSLEAEVLPKDVPRGDDVSHEQPSHLSMAEPPASTAAVEQPAQPGATQEQTMDADEALPASSGTDWDDVAKGEAKVTLVAAQQPPTAERCSTPGPRTPSWW
ncbi:hypothetical protein WJX81_002761 [Elliptochloris bilobata]|uniref:Uncharacterized protein n=1 Tax=Elliptochloris bilobata TaxID=381761 RepID=A0AAW1QXT3_9CHLO